MSRWPRGEADVEELLRRGELEHLTGGAADGSLLLAQAERTVATAAGLIAIDAHSAYVLAYDATRFACVSLLAQQGMRATTSGGHYAVERAVRAQFGPGFRAFGDVRRRRNELEYPRLAWISTSSASEGRSHAGRRGCATAGYRGDGATRAAVILRLAAAAVPRHGGNALRSPTLDPKIADACLANPAIRNAACSS